LVEPHVLVATRVTPRREFGWSIVGFEGSDMLVCFMAVMMRERVR